MRPGKRSIVRTLTLSTLTTLAALAAGCGGSGGDDDRAGNAVRAGDTAAPPAAQQASIFPNAPSPVIREAVKETALEVEAGEATFYADTFEGRRTASGRAFRQSEMVAAHRAFPFGTRLRVTNTRNDRDVEVRVVDRGPFSVSGKLPAVLDLSRAAAERLDFIREGRAQVRVEVLEWGP